MHLFLVCTSSCKRSNCRRLNTLQKPFGTQPTGQVWIFAEEKSNHSSLSKKGWSNAWWNTAPSLQVKEFRSPSRKARKPQKVCLGLGLQVSWTLAKFVYSSLEASSGGKKNIFYVVAESTFCPRNLKSLNNMNIKSPLLKQQPGTSF